MSYLVFKWRTQRKIPTDLYHITNEMVGYSRIDDFPFYKINFECDISLLKNLYEDDDCDIFEEVSKQLRKFKIQKIIYKMKGLEYTNKDLDKFSIFLQYYYSENGDIDIVEQINNKI